jgi:hypothetical protein
MNVNSQFISRDGVIPATKLYHETGVAAIRQMPASNDL